MIEMEQATIAGLGPIWMPKHRAERPQRPWWEAARLHSMHHYLTPEDRVLDIGTEEGDMSALIATWVDTIFLVEPNPKAWPWIAETFAANQLSDLVRGWWVGMVGSTELAGKQHGYLEKNHRGSARWPEYAYMEKPVPDHGFFHLAEHRVVSPVITIDELLDDIPWRPTAITMDIEGGELHALVGARGTLLLHRPKVWVSVHPESMRDLYGMEANELFIFMEQMDYDAVFLATDHEEHWLFLPQEMGWRY